MATVNSVNTYIVPTTSNEITIPNQPAFSAYLASDDDNETGNGTVFYIGDTDVGTAMTEIFDQNSDFTTGSSSGATFTAPVTGRYVLMAGIRADEIGVSDNEFNKISTSNRRYYLSDWDCDTLADGGDAIFTGGQFICDMDAADTARFFILCKNKGANTVDVQGSAIAETYFMGYLLV